MRSCRGRRPTRWPAGTPTGPAKGRRAWQRTAREATKQSRRAWVPVVSPLASTAQVADRGCARRRPRWCCTRTPTRASGSAGLPSSGRARAGRRPRGRHHRRRAGGVRRGRRDVRPAGRGGAAHLDRRRRGPGRAEPPPRSLGGRLLRWPDDCLFCRIVAGEIPATRLREDDDTLVFPDINPQAPTHVLVIPKQHLRDIGELAADPAASAARAGGNPGDSPPTPGSATTGPCSTPAPRPGQSVFHVHAHVLAGRPMGWPPG